jgi:predicted AAA+ superfamily ATPase
MQRYIAPKIQEHLSNNPLLLLLGMRGVQSEQLVESVIEDKEQILHLDGSKKKTIKKLENTQKGDFIKVFEGKKYVLFKDAQFFTRLQEMIEEVIFNRYEMHLVLCCSYEPVIDKMFRDVLRTEGLEMRIYPLMFQEMANQMGVVEFDKRLEERLIYGNFPEVLTNPENADKYLIGLVKEAVFTHLNPKERINKGAKLMKLLQCLAFDLGEPISYYDLGFRVGLDNETVERYIDLLEKAFILKKIPSYFNDHRYELKKTHLVYFMDNGFRNAIIKNFHPLDLRNDVDALWKNWLIAERIKWNDFNNNVNTYYFWRTHTRLQMDFIEEKAGQIMAYKSIWDKRRKPKFPLSFKKYYPEAGQFALNRSTYWGFLSKK